MTKRFQVVGIGNALVDVLAYCDEAFMEMNGVRKGIMQLIDVNRGIDLYSRIGPAREISGGSVANSVTGIAQLGGRAAFVGKIKDDQLGSTFADDMRAQGIVFDTSPAPDCHPAETGRCIVLVTPDGERSMNTYLGVTEFLVPSDIDEGMMADAEWIFLEGYRFDGPESQEAFAKAIFVSRNAGGKVAITLSDPFCVERHRDAFGAMLRDHADLVLANRAELLSMYGSHDLDSALAAAAAEVKLVACTDGENGVHVVMDGRRWHVPAIMTEVVDLTGAGDLFAGAFLWGLAEGYDPETCARMGNIAASEIIGHIGARPEADLRELFISAGVLQHH